MIIYGDIYVNKNRMSEFGEIKVIIYRNIYVNGNIMSEFEVINVIFTIIFT